MITVSRTGQSVDRYAKLRKGDCITLRFTHLHSDPCRIPLYCRRNGPSNLLTKHWRLILHVVLSRVCQYKGDVKQGESGPLQPPLLACQCQWVYYTAVQLGGRHDAPLRLLINTEENIQSHWPLGGTASGGQACGAGPGRATDSLNEGAVNVSRGLCVGQVSRLVCGLVEPSCSPATGLFVVSSTWGGFSVKLAYIDH